MLFNNVPTYTVVKYMVMLIAYTPAEIGQIGTTFALLFTTVNYNLPCYLLTLSRTHENTHTHDT